MCFWPPLWQRHRLEERQIQELIRKLLKFSSQLKDFDVLSLVLGIEADKILSVIASLKSEKAKIYAISNFQSLLLGNHTEALEKITRDLIQKK